MHTFRILQRHSTMSMYRRHLSSLSRFLPSTSSFSATSSVHYTSTDIKTDKQSNPIFFHPISKYSLGLGRSFHKSAFRCEANSNFEMLVPSMGDSITSGSIAEWVKNEGDYVHVDDVIVVIETDKVSVDVRASNAGKIISVVGEEGDTVDVGAPLCYIDETAEAPAGSETSASSSSSSEAEPSSSSIESASAPPASTPAPAPSPASTPAPASKAPSPPTPAPVVKSSERSETRVKMTRMRQRIAERLKSAQNTCAMLTTFQEVDMTELIEMRKLYKEEFEKKHNIKLGFMSAFVKASAAALEEIPAVNAYIDDETKEIVYRNYVDISVAVSSPTGLVVPVLRNCEAMGFKDVESTIAMYGKKAKEGTLALEDMAGGTFTISNGGVFGSLFGTPIINPPQSAILGMHATKLRAMVDPKTGAVVARPMMYLALTYDHRLIDGREAVTFLKSIQAKIEDPKKMLLEL